MTPHVINLGLPKTGTTTLARALKLSGLVTIDHRVRKRQTENSALHGAYVGDLIYQGYFRSGDPLDLLSGFDAISEMSCLRKGRSLWPQTDFGVIEALRQLHPEARFIATRRPTFDISQSMLAWSDLGLVRLPSGEIPGLPQGFGETSKERETWIDAHYAHLDRIFAGDPRYLELDVAAVDAAEQLASHIGRPVPWWGRANTNPETAA